MSSIDELINELDNCVLTKRTASELGRVLVEKMTLIQYKNASQHEKVVSQNIINVFSAVELTDKGIKRRIFQSGNNPILKLTERRHSYPASVQYNGDIFESNHVSPATAVNKLKQSKMYFVQNPGGSQMPVDGVLFYQSSDSIVHLLYFEFKTSSEKNKITLNENMLSMDHILVVNKNIRTPHAFISDEIVSNHNEVREMIDKYNQTIRPKKGRSIRFAPLSINGPEPNSDDIAFLETKLNIFLSGFKY